METALLRNFFEVYIKPAFHADTIKYQLMFTLHVLLFTLEKTLHIKYGSNENFLYILTKIWEIFFKILWPSENIWILLFSMMNLMVVSLVVWKPFNQVLSFWNSRYNYEHYLYYICTCTLEGASKKFLGFKTTFFVGNRH